MDDRIYLKFAAPKKADVPESGHLQRMIENAIEKVISSIIPKANPDFDHLINKVKYWKIEFDVNNGVTIREIGYCADEKPIVAMPKGENYGFWTDNSLTLQDYESFDSVIVSADDFERDWEKIK